MYSSSLEFSRGTSVSLSSFLLYKGAHVMAGRTVLIFFLLVSHCQHAVLLSYLPLITTHLRLRPLLLFHSMIERVVI